MDEDVKQAFEKIDRQFDDVKKAFEVTWTMMERSAQETRDELRGEFRSGLAELRDELRGEVAEVRDELRGELCGEIAGLRGEIAEVRDELRGEMRAGFAAVHAEFADVRSDIRIVAQSVLALDEKLERRLAPLERRR